MKIARIFAQAFVGAGICMEDCTGHLDERLHGNLHGRLLRRLDGHLHGSLPFQLLRLSAGNLHGICTGISGSC